MYASRVDWTHDRAAFVASFDAFITCSYVTRDTFAATTHTYGVSITLGALVHFAMSSRILYITVTIISAGNLDTSAAIETWVGMAVIFGNNQLLFAARSTVTLLADASRLAINRFTDSTIQTVARTTNNFFAFRSCKAFWTFTLVSSWTRFFASTPILTWIWVTNPEPLS